MNDESKIKTPEADELLKHGGKDGYKEADDWYDIQTHDESDMDASWRLKGTDRTQSLADGTQSEGLARVALQEREQNKVVGRMSRRIAGILGDLTEEEMWQVLRYGDVINTDSMDEPTAKKILNEKEELERKEYERLKAKYEAESRRDAELARLKELKEKFEE